LDIGGGRGQLWWDENPKINYANDLDITIVDKDIGAIKIAKEWGFKTIKMSANKPLLLSDNSFDTVVASHIIEHLESPYKFLLEVKRIMKSDGILILSLPNNSSWSHIFMDNSSEHLSHKYSFNNKGIVFLLKRTGFGVIKQYTVFPTKSKVAGIIWNSIPILKTHWQDFTYICKITK